MRIRTQVFKDSWAHKGQWPAYLDKPSYFPVQGSNATDEGLDYARRSYWQQVADEVREGIQGIALT